MKLSNMLFVLGILLFASVLRFVGSNWDQGFMLHPDERFLTMVGNAMQLPASFGDYLDPAKSSMNPANINFAFFVYGLFPITVNKLLFVLLKTNAPLTFMLQGRFLSGLLDTITVLFVYKTVLLLEKHNEKKIPSSLKFWAAFFYAIAVLPIQLSHFFAVDIFLNTFVFVSFYFVLRFWFTGSLVNFFLCAFFVGL